MNKIFVISCLVFITTIINPQSRKWETYFCGREINSLASKGKDLYAGTNYGLVHIDLETDEVTHVNKISGNIPLENTKNIYIKNNGDLLFNTYGCISSISEYSPKYKLYDCRGYFDLTCATEDSTGNMWMGGSYSGIQHSTADGIYGRMWHVLNKSNSPLPGDNVKSMKFDKDHNLWILIYEYDDRENSSGGLVKYDGKNWTVFNKSNSPITTNQLTAMAFDKYENIWIGTDWGKGLWKFSNGEWTKYELPKLNYYGYSKPIISSIAIDNSGNIWVGTMFSGLLMFNGKEWKSYHSENTELASPYINSVIVDFKNRVWVGTRIGLYRLENEKFIEYNTSNSPLPNNLTRKILPDSRGNLWILNDDYGSYGNLLKNSAAISLLSNRNFSVYRASEIALTNYYFFSATIDIADNVWAVTNNGLYKSDGVKWEKYKFEFMQGYQPHSICADILGNIWVGTYYGDLVKFDGNTFIIYTAQENKIPTKPIKILKTLGQDIYFGLEEDNNIYQFNLIESKKSLSIKALTAPCKTINDFSIDKNNDLWVATFEKGLLYFNGSSWISFDKENSNLLKDNIRSVDINKFGEVLIVYYNYSTYKNGFSIKNSWKWNHYSYEDSELGFNSLYEGRFDSNGNVWICGYGGITFFNYDERRKQYSNTDEVFPLYPSFPNPTNGFSVIKYSIDKPTRVVIAIYDVLGRRIKELVNSEKEKGNYITYWDGKNNFGENVNSGIYFYNMIFDNQNFTRRLVLQK